MKRKPKKVITPPDLKKSAAAKIFPGLKIRTDKQLEKKGIFRKEVPSEVKPNKTADRKAARAAERRKARLVEIPQKYKKALSQYGLGAAQGIIKKRGRYYTAAGVYDKKRFGLEVKHVTDPKTGKRIDPGNPYAWAPSDKKGWFIVSVASVVQPKLKRWAEVDKEQKRAWRSKKIEVVAAKTGLTKTAVKKIISTIRKEEATKLRRYKKTKAYKKLKPWEKKKNTIANRVTAIFGALCDLLEVYGSPTAKPD